MTEWRCHTCGWSCPDERASLQLVLLHDEQHVGQHLLRRQPVMPAKNDATR